MSLRERLWCRKLAITKKCRLPRVNKHWLKSGTWEKQQPHIDLDLTRMPRMHRENVYKIVQRHAATTPWHPYTQGHLYLIYGIALVLRGEHALYWGYTRLCHFVYPYGPDTPYDKVVVPEPVFEVVNAHFTVCRNLFDVVIRMRWLYIMFGQTFTTPATLCIIWDYVLLDTVNIFRLSYVLLDYALEHEIKDDRCCNTERLSKLVSIQINCPLVAAQLIAKACALMWQMPKA